jgi:SAM-dependent methyltransferase
VDGYHPAAYGDAFADVYDEWYHDVSDVPATVERLVALAGGGRVLELGIGTGRIALPLAARGVPVSGIDASPAMVAALRRKAGAAALDVVLGDMSEDLPEGPFSVVFAAFNTLFNLPTADAQARCMALAESRLSAEGRLVIEAFVPDDRSDASGRVEVRHATPERVVLSVSRSLPDVQRAEGQFVEVGADGSVQTRPWLIRYAAPTELDAMAAACGLVLTERWSDWRQAPFSGDSVQHVSVYRRVEESAT